MKKFFECVFDFLSEVWDFLPAMLISAVFFCIPSVIQLIGFTKIAFISFIILLAIIGILFVYTVVKFIRAKKDEWADQMSRCVLVWIVWGGGALIGTLVAKLVGLL